VRIRSIAFGQFHISPARVAFGQDDEINPRSSEVVIKRLMPDFWERQIKSAFSSRQKNWGGTPSPLHARCEIEICSKSIFCLRVSMWAGTPSEGPPFAQAGVLILFYPLFSCLCSNNLGLPRYLIHSSSLIGRGVPDHLGAGFGQTRVGLAPTPFASALSCSGFQKRAQGRACLPSWVTILRAFFVSVRAGPGCSMRSGEGVFCRIRQAVGGAKFP